MNDNESLFARRVNLKSPFKISDFNYSQSKRPETEDCMEWCGIRSLSVHKYNMESKQEVIQRNIIYMGVAPASKKQLSVFKIKTGGGLVKNTPNQKHGLDQFHYDFYKPDDFNVENHLELVE